MEAINGYNFRTELAKLIPNYELGEDNDGQIIIYTNLTVGEGDTYKEMGDK
jgi:hypothetical protein